MSAAGTMTPTILSLNVGSSSLKYGLFRCGSSPDGETRLAGGAIERIGVDDRLADQGAAVAAARATLREQGLPEPDTVGHRLVHGGPRHARPERVSAALLGSLREKVSFAPLHLPAALEAIAAVAVRFPRLPQVVCFDTAFHEGLPEVSRRLPLPRSLYDQSVRRYGFHGPSYEYVVSKLGAAVLGRAVIAHLGHGASMVAVRSGQPIDTSMGLTPSGGLMMGTRSGDLDPGVLLYLLGARVDAIALDRIINHRSGLLGVPGTSSDMKALLELRATDARAECCAGLACLGIWLDPARNEASTAVVSTGQSACTVRVVRTDEELMIARHTRRLVFPDPQ